MSESGGRCDVPPRWLWPTWHRCAEVVNSFLSQGAKYLVFHPQEDKKENHLPPHSDVLQLFRSLEQSRRQLYCLAGTVTSVVLGDLVDPDKQLWPTEEVGAAAAEAGALVSSSGDLRPCEMNVVHHFDHRSKALRFAQRVRSDKDEDGGQAVVVCCQTFLRFSILHHLPLPLPELPARRGAKGYPAVPAAPTLGAWLCQAAQAEGRQGGRPELLVCTGKSEEYVTLKGCSAALVEAAAKHLSKEKHGIMVDRSCKITTRSGQLQLQLSAEWWGDMRLRMERTERHCPPAPAPLRSGSPLRFGSPHSVRLCIYDKMRHRQHQLLLDPPAALRDLPRTACEVESKAPPWLRQTLALADTDTEDNRKLQRELKRKASAGASAASLAREERRLRLDAGWRRAAPVLQQELPELFLTLDDDEWPGFADMRPVAEKLALQGVWSESPDLLMHQWSMLRLLGQLPAAAKAFMADHCVCCGGLNNYYVVAVELFRAFCPAGRGLRKLWIAHGEELKPWLEENGLSLAAGRSAEEIRRLVRREPLLRAFQAKFLRLAESLRKSCRTLEDEEEVEVAGSNMFRKYIILW